MKLPLLMLASHNILNPANGAPITVPSQDMVLGLYYVTKGRKNTPDYPIVGEGKTFYSAEEVIIAINEGRLSKHANIKVRGKVRGENNKLETKIETVAGRVIFNQFVPEEVGFINIGTPPSAVTARWRLLRSRRPSTIRWITSRCMVSSSARGLDWSPAPSGEARSRSATTCGSATTRSSCRTWTLSATAPWSLPAAVVNKDVPPYAVVVGNPAWGRPVPLRSGRRSNTCLPRSGGRRTSRRSAVIPGSTPGRTKSLTLTIPARSPRPSLRPPPPQADERQSEAASAIAARNARNDRSTVGVEVPGIGGVGIGPSRSRLCPTVAANAVGSVAIGRLDGGDVEQPARLGVLGADQRVELLPGDVVLRPHGRRARDGPDRCPRAARVRLSAARSPPRT